ncbi:hypothetical protein [Neogemmobacter tilapiae]|uniref:Uncharacterized protein n=1 Tax=Neogemmobacter tilapiae TaxID=875041 RepID=A0A918WMH0_9RHOB|nr:hypothetical protein [Gemmobacter tilapiae]GHC58742.1 hypothetical protein GCM10007315_23080 [Gemmobacter tilapiae]
MSFEERNAAVGIVISLIAWGLMISVLSQRQAAGVFDGADGPMLWARTVCWLIAACIAIGIALTVLATVLYAAVTGERSPSFEKDERDNQIGLRGLQVTLVVMSMGIVGSIGALAWGVTVVMALNLILASCALGDMAGTLVKLFLYRRGMAW